MLGRYLLPIFAAIGCLIMVGTLTLVWGQQQTPQTSPKVQEQLDGKLEPATPSNTPCTNCVSDNDTRKEAREEADLVAQQDMARWAFVMVAVAIVQLIATVGTVGLLWCTFREARRTTRAGIRAAAAATKSARVADTAMRNLDRAYLFAGPDEIQWDPFKEVTTLVLSIHNFGKTPAFFKEVLIEFADTLPGEVPVYGVSENYTVGRIDTVIGSGGVYLGSGNKYSFRGIGPIHIFGYVKYEDIFKTKHTSRFCCLVENRKIRAAGNAAWNEWD